MECRSCPYVKDEFNTRMCHYSDTINQKGIPNDIYGYLDYDGAVDDLETYCWCEKTGGKLYWYGQCSDAHLKEAKKKISSKRKKRNKRERYLKYKHHLKHLYNINTGYPPPVIYTDEVWICRQGWVDNPKPYYKRLYRSKMSKFHKKLSNRKIRRYKGKLPNGFGCHKLYDYWYEMY